MMTSRRDAVRSGLLLAICAAVLAGAAPSAHAQYTFGAPQATELWGGPAAKGVGASGSRFDTSVTVTAFLTAATGTIDYWAGGTLKATVPFSVAPLAVAVVPTPAALEGAGAFLYHVTSSAAVTVYSETYNDTPNGRFGVSIPAFTTSDFLRAGDQGSGGGAEDSPDPAHARTNVGILCSPSSAVACQAQVIAYSDGSLLGNGTLTAAPGAVAQQSLSAVVPMASGMPGVSVQVRILAGVAQPYLIRNDNRTSDGTQIPIAVTRNAFSTAPTITSFNVTPDTGCAPLSATLSWTTTNAVKVTVSGVTGELPPNGSTTVSVPVTMDLVLVATAESGATSASTRHVTITPSASEPTPSPADAQVITGGTITGIIPPEPAGTVSYAFVQQGSGNSTFTLNGSAWTYVAGGTPGTDVVRITANGPCGPVTSDLTITVLAPGAPKITSFTAEPSIGCAPANIILSWTTVDAVRVEITGQPFPYGPNGSAQATISTTTTFTLKAYGANGKTTTKQLTVPVDTAPPVPILTPNSAIVHPYDQVDIVLTNVPDLNTVGIVRQQMQSGGTFLGTGFGHFLYTAGPIGGGTVDIVRVYTHNGCGYIYAQFQATVQ